MYTSLPSPNWLSQSTRLRSVLKKSLQSLIKGKTVIIIAHRLSSIVSADNIVVLQQGRIVQQGQHDDLSVAEGLYKNMWDAYTSAYHWKLNKN